MNSIIMGFDFGMKRIGVAVGQKVTQTASGLTLCKRVMVFLDGNTLIR